MDAMEPKKTEVIEDQEENNTTENSRTGSLHINDCNLSGSMSEIKEDDEESDAIVLDTEDGTTDIILNEVKIEENNIIMTNSGGETGRVSTLTVTEAMLCKKLKKTDLFSGNGLRFPVKELREKLLPHITAPAIGEKTNLTLVDHQGKEWEMLLVRQSEHVYYIKGQWRDYAKKYNLTVSDTVVIERITKKQVKEDLDFGAVSEIGNHDWDNIYPPNSKWQIEQVNNINAEDVKKPDELAEQTEIKDIGKVEQVVVMYGITIKKG